MAPVPITLLTAAAAVFVNMWLGGRVVSSRRQHQIKLGDGGNEAVLRRMRAQANFIENAPFFLILLGGLELSGANQVALAVIAAVRPRADFPRHWHGRRLCVALANVRDDGQHFGHRRARLVGDRLRGRDLPRRLVPRR